MSDAEQGDDGQAPADPRARWTTDAAGIEAIGAVAEIEDLTTPEQRKLNEEAARFRERSLALARKLVDQGIDEDEGAEHGSAPKDG